MDPHGADRESARQDCSILGGEQQVENLFHSQSVTYKDYCAALFRCLILFGCSKFYEREALLRDPVDGPILASLLGIKPITFFPKLIMVNKVRLVGWEGRAVKQSRWIIAKFSIAIRTLKKGFSRRSLEVLSIRIKSGSARNPH